MTEGTSEDTLLAQLAWVRPLAVALARDEAGAEDLVQEAWLVARRHPRRPVDRGELAQWLRGVVRKRALRARRTEGRRRSHEAAGARAAGRAGAGDGDGAVPQLHGRDLADTVARAE